MISYVNARLTLIKIEKIVGILNIPNFLCGLLGLLASFVDLNAGWGINGYCIIDWPVTGHEGSRNPTLVLSQEIP